MYIKNFEDISKKDVREVGGKGASLGEMTQVGIPVPPGFVLTAEVYQHFSETKIPDDVKEKILKAFDELGAERVAVRSSAITEDSFQASWAGQLESYLNINRVQLINAIYRCWNSIKSERALAYATQQNTNHENLVVAVVIQEMVESEISGVIFSTNPVTKNTNEIMIEASFGLGEMLVQGLITPDNFLVDKHSLQIKERNIETKGTMLIFHAGETKEVLVTEEKRDQPALSDEQIKELAKISIKIANHYDSPQDIEWAIDRKGVVWIVQSRSITTLD